MKNYLPRAAIFLSLIVMFPVDYLRGQDTIYLKNPSFEDVARKGKPGAPPIQNWTDCGGEQFPGTSPPDIHPAKEKFWGVTLQPQEGKTYLGLVVRANSSWESVSQELSHPLQQGFCYSLQAMLALSETYNSSTTTSQIIYGQYERESFVHPAVLVIWGGQHECDKMQILGVSSDVDNFEWKPYSFIFSAHHDYTHITFEAYYSKSSTKLYNGHIMIDNLTPIVEIECK